MMPVRQELCQEQLEARSDLQDTVFAAARHVGTNGAVTLPWSV